MQHAKKQPQLDRAMLDAALSYVAMGWSVIPLYPKSKLPAAELLPADPITGARSWKPFAYRPASEAEVRAWFERIPNLNLAVLTGLVSGGLVVVDIDEPGAAKGLHLPPTVAASSGREGGAHYWFKANGPVPSRKRPWGDLLGDGKYVVAPPSVHPNGNRYTWADFCSPDRHAMADLPSAFRADGDEEQSPSTDTREGTKEKYTFTRYLPDDSLEALPAPTDYDLSKWSKSEKAALSIMRLCGVERPQMKKGFRCPLPGHEEKKASASLFRMKDGAIWLHDFHRKSGAEWYTLAEVYASVKSGKVRRLSKGEQVVWHLRALMEAKLLQAPAVMAPRLPTDAPPVVRDVYEGFKLLLSVRMLYNPAQTSAPYTRSFAATWCQRGERQCGEAINWLLRSGHITRTAKKGDSIEGGRTLSAGLLALGTPKSYINESR